MNFAAVNSLWEKTQFFARATQVKKTSFTDLIFYRRHNR